MVSDEAWQGVVSAWLVLTRERRRRGGARGEGGGRGKRRKERREGGQWVSSGWHFAYYKDWGEERTFVFNAKQKLQFFEC